ncbi:MAG: hypothetical protein ACK5PF_05595, partial [bacterium]
MPTYVIRDPDGKDWEIDGPEGATREQIIERVTKSTEYANAKYLQKKTSKIPNPTNAIPDPEGLPDNAATNAGDTTAWLRATTKEEKYDPPWKDVLESGRRGARDALRRTWEQLKNSDLTPEQKAFHRKSFEEQLARENSDLQIDYERLPPEKKLLHMAPGAAAVGGGALAGLLTGGPPGAAAAGGGVLA